MVFIVLKYSVSSCGCLFVGRFSYVSSLFMCVLYGMLLL